MVVKLDETGRELWRYAARVLRREPQAIMVEAFFDLEAAYIGPAVFRRGDRFVESYYSDRWYNVFAVYDGQTGPLKGWYCNICYPADIGPRQVSFKDLALDVWASPTGQTYVLDEDEFQELALSAEHRAQARTALAQVVALAEAGGLPK